MCSDLILYDVVPMILMHILLCQPRFYDRDVQHVQHDDTNNTYHFMLDTKDIILKPLTTEEMSKNKLLSVKEIKRNEKNCHVFLRVKTMRLFKIFYYLRRVLWKINVRRKLSQ